MRVFISWSGERSKALALGLRTWIPHVIPIAETFVSETDIPKGQQWFPHVNKTLADADYGIIIVTPENQEKPWVQFEAGALCGLKGHDRACPLVLGMTKTDVGPPLSGLNLTDSASKDDVHQLIRTICPPEISQGNLDHCFEREWPALSIEIDKALALPVPLELPDAGRSDASKLDEVLLSIRDLAGRPQGRPLALGPSVQDRSPTLEAICGAWGVGIISTELVDQPLGGQEYRVQLMGRADLSSVSKERAAAELFDAHSGVDEIAIMWDGGGFRRHRNSMSG